MGISFTDEREYLPKLKVKSKDIPHERVVLPTLNTFENKDCMDVLIQCPTDYFDLAIVDPPYGLGKRTVQGGTGEKTKNSMKKFINDIYKKRWDDSPPDATYFGELMRVSKNQIIWGGNYFGLPKHRCFIVWDKLTFPPTMSRVEQAWTSFDSPARLIEINSNNKDRIHPTQKPVELYRQLLREFGRAGDKILDTHVGSGSSLIACIELGYDYYGTEIDKDYYEKAKKRISRAFRKPELFD